MSENVKAWLIPIAWIIGLGTLAHVVGDSMEPGTKSFVMMLIFAFYFDHKLNKILEEIRSK